MRTPGAVASARVLLVGAVHPHSRICEPPLALPSPSPLTSYSFPAANASIVAVDAGGIEQQSTSLRPRAHPHRKWHVVIGVAIVVLLAFVIVAGVLLSRRDGGSSPVSSPSTGGSSASGDSNTLSDDRNATSTMGPASTTTAPGGATPSIPSISPPTSALTAPPSTTISPGTVPNNSAPTSDPSSTDIPTTYPCTILRQSDFDYGTYLIQEPGCFRLAEDIRFNPNSRTTLAGAACPTCHNWPQLQQFRPAGPYDPRAFGIGFFAAIAISASNVYLDLNGHTLQQSAEHALAQRFYANIELASTPFFHGQGPFDFGIGSAARHVLIENGRLGRASHHGIHGNQNTNITLRHLTIVDWEVAGIALNGGRDIRIDNVEIGPNFRRVPVTGMFSAARFLSLYLSYLQPNSTFNACASGDEATQPLSFNFNPVGGPGPKTAVEVWNELVAFEEEVFDAVLAAESASAATDRSGVPTLVRNFHGLTDGNIYGILLHSRGVAVNGIGPSPALHVAGENEV